MKKIIVIGLIFQISLYQYGQIIADHTVIAKFDEIPAYYIGEVKKMMVGFYGESHSGAYDSGMELLEALNGTYACNVGTGQSYTEQYVRVEDVGGGIGEDLWFTWYSYPIGSRPDDWKVTWLKDRISDYKNSNHPFNALGFAWCNDLTSSDYGYSALDTEYGVHWYGRSAGGIDGNKYWGLNSDDYLTTGNRVNLSTYFGAMEEIIAYCATNSPTTKMIFTTGPVDVTYGEFIGEAGYQGHLKHEAIRAYVKANTSRILFDYADILCYDNNGTATTQTWNGHTYPAIAAANFAPTVDAYHISQAGAIRLAKAQWWLLARLAGWNGTTTAINKLLENEEQELHIQKTDEEIIIRLNNSFVPTNARLYDLTGKLINMKSEISEIYRFDISSLLPGLYFVVVSNSITQKTKKIVIS